ncbi:c-type cytochrome [Campylobacter hepaticus]|uniref:c-type cytochrome n=1 Tax=Campylobacter hepaticus TaxID=1813019 RepID=UPI0018C023D9|nr:c-type cytochrome [Campylobacter hepaticus]MCZ0772444.1 c-type cytochrome [Campylobacter hepaticus]MCZ0773912.1 c-type cytochrome [Campylobacter hepaticus]MCZ0775163.1 c-type cytochrome [Campylobacter hepaticus]MDX2323333.1 c-type cytochrome [Campylobacter hepaticus]MDX2331180.1 c-type cytochrome [Campylobacter hepaticus]
MKFVLMFFLLNINLFSADFITLKEYAKMLYENPRGISCKKCHGKDGSEQILGYYTKNGIKTAYKIPSIQNLNFEKFKNSLNQTKNTKSIMPNYSLTDDEVMTLYNYIKQFSKEEK